MIEKQQYDIAVIGAGPGGYAAAFRAADLGFNVTMIDKNPNLGGVCLNVGCIPSKALLESSEHFFQSIHEFKDHGINTGSVKIDIQRTMQRKAKIISEMHMGLDFLMKKNKISIFHGINENMKNR